MRDISVSCKQNIGTNDEVAKESVRGACCASNKLRWPGERAALRMFSTESRQKKKNLGAPRVAQTYRGGFAMCSSVSPRWLQGHPCHPFQKKLLVRRKRNTENK